MEDTTISAPEYSTPTREENQARLARELESLASSLEYLVSLSLRANLRDFEVATWAIGTLHELHQLRLADAEAQIPF